MPKAKAKAPEPPEVIVVGDVSYEVRSTTWGQLGVGSTIRDNGGRRWTCIAAAQPQQFEYGKTCWLRFRAPNGDEIAIPPRYVNFRVNALIDPAAPRIEPAWPDGAEAAWLLAQELGAEEIATQDKRTGEVWCPDYVFSTGPAVGLPAAEPGEGLLRHLEICHAVDTAGLRGIQPWDVQSEAIYAAHDRAHKHPVGGAGFAHRHIPEDHSIL
jgi:hypothetical protein